MFKLKSVNASVTTIDSSSEVGQGQCSVGKRYVDIGAAGPDLGWYPKSCGYRDTALDRRPDDHSLVKERKDV